MKIEEYLKSLPNNIISGEDVQLPEKSFREIFKFLNLGKDDIFFHLGCNNEKGIEIAINEFKVTKAIGIDNNLEKIQNAQKNIKEKKFDLVFSGIFQEMSLYLGFAKHGVFQFITRIQLLEQELIKQNLKDKKLEKRNIGRSKKGWILEIADDAEEEAEFQCNRMDFLEKKAKSLTNQLIINL